MGKFFSPECPPVETKTKKGLCANDGCDNKRRHCSKYCGDCSKK